ncbi:hypothetical protein D3C80_2095530 [compost metagenome]
MNWNRPEADEVEARAEGFIALSRRAVFIRKSKSTPVVLDARRMAASTPPDDGIAPTLIWLTVANQG